MGKQAFLVYWKCDQPLNIFCLPVSHTTIKEGHYLEQSYPYCMSQCWYVVLKLQNLAAYQTYQINLANLYHWALCSRMGLNLAAYQTYQINLANLYHWALCSRMGLNSLVVCLPFNMSSKVLKKENIKITLVKNHSLAVIKQYHFTYIRYFVRKKDQTYLRVNVFVVTHGLESSLHPLRSKKFRVH